MSLKTGFISHRKLILKTSGEHINVDVTGSMFICKEASYPFEMQFNNGQWFDFDQGLTFNIAPDLFTTLSFRAKVPATEDIHPVQHTRSGRPDNRD